MVCAVITFHRGWRYSVRLPTAHKQQGARGSGSALEYFACTVCLTSYASLGPFDDSRVFKRSMSSAAAELLCVSDGPDPRIYPPVTNKVKS